MGSKTLVVFFSASGITQRLATELARQAGADLAKIEPEIPYTQPDLDWSNKQSRSSIEMADRAFRPAISAATRSIQVDGYDTVLIGFPVWWYDAPTIVLSFLDGVDLTGKRAAVFVTSGSTGVAGPANTIQQAAPDATWMSSKRFSSAWTQEELSIWLNTVLQ